MDDRDGTYPEDDRFIEIECAHCHHVFRYPVRPGRRRLYCRRSCRQRAYEARRRTIAPPRGPWAGHKDPTTGRLWTDPRQLPPRWLGGRRAWIVGKIHALRPGPPDGRGRVPTLCGTHATPVAMAFYGAHQPDACKTCSRLLGRQPPPSAKPALFDLLTVQGHLLDVGKALDELTARHQLDRDRLAALLERALLPVDAWRGTGWGRIRADAVA